MTIGNAESIFHRKVVSYCPDSDICVYNVSTCMSLKRELGCKIYAKSKNREEATMRQVYEQLMGAHNAKTVLRQPLKARGVFSVLAREAIIERPRLNALTQVIQPTSLSRT